MNRFSNFLVVEAGPIDDSSGLGLKLRNPEDGRYREAELVILQDNLTKELSVGVVRHYTDPSSEPWFQGTQPWTPEEKETEERWEL